MEVLLRSRAHFKASINRVHSFSLSIAPETSVESIEVRLDCLEDAWKDFNSNQFDLLGHHGDEGYVDPEDEFVSFETKFIEAKSSLLSFLRGSASNSKRATGMENGNSSYSHEKVLEGSENHSTPTGSEICREIELPAFKITSFGGDYREWPCFRDMFLGSIDCRKNLSGAQKFRYLKSFLRDEPANLLNGIVISDANYVQAWEKLERRYDRPLYIINQFIEMFLNIPSVSSADHRLLRKLVDSADEVLRGLAAIGSENRDPWLIFLLLNKTDSDTRQAWALNNTFSEEATIIQLIEFLEVRCSALEASESKLKSHKTDYRPSKFSGKIKSLAVNKIICPKCKKEHYLHKCSEFLASSIDERRRFAKEQKLCYNCLGTQHSSSRCQSKSRCFHCSSRHHSLVCLNPAGISRIESVSQAESSPTLPSSSVPIVSNHIKSLNSSTLILPTALVEVVDAIGNVCKLRALLDTGSQVSFVTDRAVRMLGLSRSHSRLPISGIAAVAAGVTQGVVTLHLTSRLEPSPIFVRAFVLKTITSATPSTSFNLESLVDFSDLQLADPEFNRRGPIDILLGSDMVWSSLRDGHRSDSKGNIIAHNTIFGWVLAGHVQKCPIVSMHVEIEVDHLMKSFWEIEEVACQVPAIGNEDFADFL